MVCSPDTDPVLDEPGLVDMLRLRAQSFSCHAPVPAGCVDASACRCTTGRTVQARAGGLYRDFAGRFARLPTPGPDAGNAVRRNRSVMPVAANRDLSSPGTVLLTKVKWPPISVWPGYRPVLKWVTLATHLELARATGAPARLPGIDGGFGRDDPRRQGTWHCGDGRRPINHLHLIDIDIGHYDSNFRLSPPLRTARDRDALRSAVIDGTIDAVVSDHTPASG